LWRTRGRRDSGRCTCLFAFSATPISNLKSSYNYEAIIRQINGKSHASTPSAAHISQY
jgi:hypothetical protein